jgi:hypothetical protein
MDSHDVRFSQQRLHRNTFGSDLSGLFSGQCACVGEHSSIERFKDTRDFLANPAEAQDTDGFAFKQIANHRRPRLFAHAAVDLGYFSHQRQDQRDGELLGGCAIVGRCSRYGDAAPRGGGQIEMPAGATGLGYKFQTRQ